MECLAGLKDNAVWFKQLPTEDDEQERWSTKGTSFACLKTVKRTNTSTTMDMSAKKATVRLFTTNLSKLKTIEVNDRVTIDGITYKLDSVDDVPEKNGVFLNLVA